VSRVARALDTLATLVAHPSVSHESNLDLVDWVQVRLEGCGARCRRTWNDAGTKANLLATWGPPIEGGLVLSGHLDVVPAVEPGWHSDPWVLDERDGRLYGRGTADMKGFVAAAIEAAARLDGAELRLPLHLALTYDEELGCVGAPRLIEDMVDAGLRPGLVLVGEPTGMRPAVAHKSVNLFRTEVRGVPAHSSQPHLGAGAILAAGRLVEVLWRLGDEARRRAGGEGVGGEGANAPAAGRRTLPFEPPWTTVHVGMIEGGTAPNILPAACGFTWEYRTLPGEDPDAILSAFLRESEDRVLPALREFAPEASIETTPLARVPPLLPEPGGPAEALAAALVGNVPGQGRVVAFGTEAGQFQETGASVVLLGPGSIDQAHRVNEYLERNQFERCVAVLDRLVEEHVR
jgi:acetylornithine deacetylase